MSSIQHNIPASSVRNVQRAVLFFLKNARKYLIVVTGLKMINLTALFCAMNAANYRATMKADNVCNHRRAQRFIMNWLCYVVI